MRPGNPSANFCSRASSGCGRRLRPSTAAGQPGNPGVSGAARDGHRGAWRAHAIRKRERLASRRRLRPAAQQRNSCENERDHLISVRALGGKATAAFGKDQRRRPQGIRRDRQCTPGADQENRRRASSFPNDARQTPGERCPQHVHAAARRVDRDQPLAETKRCALPHDREAGKGEQAYGDLPGHHAQGKSEQELRRGQCGKCQHDQAERRQRRPRAETPDRPRDEER